MEEPTVNSYETFLYIEARDEIGTVNLKEKGAVIAFEVMSWKALNASSGEETLNIKTPIPSQYGRVAAFASNNGELTELDLVDCRSFLTDKEFSSSDF